MFVAATNTIRLENSGGGETIDPRQTDILATTEAQPAGRYLVTVTITATDLDNSRATFEVQHRDADDNEVALETVIVAVPADDCRQYNFAFALEANERITVVPYADMLGTVMATISWQRIS